MTTSPSSEETQVAAGHSVTSSVAAQRPLRRGDTVGRYMILDKVGVGGMGVVYAAYDPELDRKLAVKLLHHARGPDASTEGRARLVREARAMAKLQHPNVITVHDVGEHDGRVFVAMEFVEGTTLKSWQRASTRSWREVLDVFRKAGHGLAAAHRKGLIHRDFKPDNVMIGDDGRVRVLDFGLARGRGEAEASRPGATMVKVDVLTSELTAAGSVMGTPAYMSPEQHAGSEVDARSDQFSFCVALYEGLYAQRPFAGETPAAIAVSVSLGEVQAAPAGHKVPGWLRAVVLRGLALEPQQRFESMDELLRVLGRDPTRRRWQAGALLGGLALAGGLYGGSELFEARRAADCERDGQAITEVWNPARRAALKEAMGVDALSYGPVAFDHAARWLDDASAGWAAATSRQCMAANDQPAANDDARHACLQERRDELSQLISILEAQGAGALASAIQAAAALTPADRCLDQGWLARHVSSPEDPGMREAVARVRKQLAEASTLGELARDEESLARAEAALVAARQTNWLPLIAAAHFTLGAAQQRDGDLDQAMVQLKSAFLVATEAGDEVTAVRAGGLLAFVAGYGQRDAALGELWREISGATLRQAGLQDDLVGASWRQSVGATYYAAGDYKMMLEYYKAAEATRAQLLGAEHPETLGSRANVATALVQLGDFQGARNILEPTTAALSQILGPDHPSLSANLGTLARVCQRLGDDDAARAHTQRALDIAMAAYGSDHVATARAMVNHANTLDDEQERLRLNEGALPALRESLGAQHPMVAGVLSNVALAHREAGNLEQAGQLLQRSLDAHANNPGREHPKTAMIMVNLAKVHIDAKRWSEAATLLEEALAVQRKALGEDHPDTAETRFRLAQARFELATSSTDRARARVLAQASVAGLSEKGSEALLADVRAWLAEHD